MLVKRPDLRPLQDEVAPPTSRLLPEFVIPRLQLVGVVFEELAPTFRQDELHGAAEAIEVDHLADDAVRPRVEVDPEADFSPLVLVEGDQSEVPGGLADRVGGEDLAVRSPVRFSLR
jgi:hypothetical protein